MSLSFPDGLVFDCDSTLATIEGFDTIALKKGVSEQTKILTDRSMNGEIPLEEVYQERLNIIQPSKEDIHWLSKQYCTHMTQGASSIIQRLKAMQLPFAIISGGLREAILPFARLLGVDEADVFAVDIRFDDNGHYHSLIPSPLTTSAGKQEIFAAWRKRYPSMKTAYMIGDGMSDIVAKGDGAANAIIGFGGVCLRENVRQIADAYVQESNIHQALVSLFPQLA